LEIEDLELSKRVRINDKDALVIVDIQNDFMPDGALGVKDGDEIIDPINQFSEKFRRTDNVVILTQDWHPPSHLSFASSHKKKPYEPFDSAGIGPILWPDHCIQGSIGARFHDRLETKFANAIIRKGYHPTVDSYSAFIENDGKTYTGLSGYLKILGKKRAFICGLALDYCVYYSAIDGKNLGFEITVLIDLSKAISSPPGHLSSALKQMVEEGVKFVKSDDVIV
jgi:nicotinamidase/pyrazinamidase